MSSGIFPVGNKILILPDQVAETTESGIILGTPQQIEREQLGQTEGVVLAVGPDAYSDAKLPWCSVGDKVVIARYSGMMRKGNDDKMYRIISDNDVVAVIS